MSYTYVGSELDLFAAAIHWKSYVRRQVSPHLGREVLEVGAGHGGTTRVLCDGRAGAGSASSRMPRSPTACWRRSARATCRIAAGCASAPWPTSTSTTGSTRSSTWTSSSTSRTIAPSSLAADRLRPGGHLIVLAPAHQWLFTPFDAEIGHFRRYSRQTLRDAANPELRPDPPRLSRRGRGCWPRSAIAWSSGAPCRIRARSPSGTVSSSPARDGRSAARLHPRQVGPGRLEKALLNEISGLVEIRPGLTQG